MDEPVFGSNESAYLWTLAIIIAAPVIVGIASLVAFFFRDACEELKRDIRNLE